MKISGAVLETEGSPRPYAQSRPRAIAELDLVSSLITLDGINEGMDELVDGEAIRQIVMFN